MELQELEETLRQVFADRAIREASQEELQQLKNLFTKEQWREIDSLIRNFDLPCLIQYSIEQRFSGEQIKVIMDWMLFFAFPLSLEALESGSDEKACCVMALNYWFALSPEEKKQNYYYVACCAKLLRLLEKYQKAIAVGLGIDLNKYNLFAQTETEYYDLLLDHLDFAFVKRVAVVLKDLGLEDY
jgi:hypothetical protein